MNIALILAGGIGSRSGEKIPKQFIEVNGKPLIIHTIEKFECSKEIDGIVVSCIQGVWQDKLKDECKKYGIQKLLGICDGGRTGLESTQNGIKFLSFYNDRDLVLIHDAVRPFIDEKSISQNISVALEHDVAMCSVDCVETLVHTVDGICSDKVISRDGMKRVLTPQTFRLGILRELYQGLDCSKSECPSTFVLYMNAGKPVYCSKGSERNIKITYPDDVKYFRNMFEAPDKFEKSI